MSRALLKEPDRNSPHPQPICPVRIQDPAPFRRGRTINRRTTPSSLPPAKGKKATRALRPTPLAPVPSWLCQVALRTNVGSRGPRPWRLCHLGSAKWHCEQTSGPGAQCPWRLCHLGSAKWHCEKSRVRRARSDLLSAVKSACWTGAMANGRLAALGAHDCVYGLEGIMRAPHVTLRLGGFLLWDRHFSPPFSKTCERERYHGS